MVPVDDILGHESETPPGRPPSRLRSRGAQVMTILLGEQKDFGGGLQAVPPLGTSSWLPSFLCGSGRQFLRVSGFVRGLHVRGSAQSAVHAA
eukprot:2687276-Pyramimonas_sp.AAC.1